MRLLRLLFCGTALFATISCCDTPTSPSFSLSTGGIQLITVTGKSQLTIGEKSPLKAVASFSDGSQQDVTSSAQWSSDNTSICTVDAKGVVTAVATGRCTISATVKDLTGKLVINITTIEGTDGNGGPGPGPGPSPLVPTGLAVQGASPIAVGQTTQWRALVIFNDGTDQDVTTLATWSSENSGVASVTGGLVRGVSAGSTRINAAYTGLTAGGNIQVTSAGGPPAPTVLSLSVSGATSIAAGESTQWQATAQMSDGTSQNVTTASTWTSGTSSVAGVVGGLVTGIAQGSSQITASFGGKSASGTVQVSAPTVLSLSISGNTSLAVGGTSQLQATAHFSNGTTQTVTTASSWTSGTPGVATVSGGLVTGVSAGSSQITAGFGGKSASVTVQVNSTAATVLSLAISGNTSLTVGSASQLQATAFMSDGTTQNVTTTSTWTSGTPSVATVASGLVTGVSAGSSLITASFSGKSASVTVTVSTTAPTVLSLSISGNTSVPVGGTSQLQATASMSDGTSQNVTSASTWTSGTPSIATVVSGLVTGVSAGSSLITAGYGGKTASVTVTVSANAPQLIGIEVQVNVNAGTVVTGNSTKPINLTLADVINGNPILGLKVFGLYSDGSKQDVTSASTIDTSSQLITIDNQGTAAVLALLVQGLINPSHYVNATYGGYTANVVVNLALPVLQGLGVGNGQPFNINVGNQLPALQATFTQGISSNMAANTPGTQYSFQLAPAVTQQLQGIPIAGPALLANLNSIVSGLSVANGVLTLAPAQASQLNSVLANPLLAPLLAAGGRLPVDMTATLNGVASAPVRANLGGS